MKEIVEIEAPRPAYPGSSFRGVITPASPAVPGKAVYLAADGELVVAEKIGHAAGTSDHVRGSSKGCRWEVPAHAGTILGPVPGEFLSQAVSAAIMVLTLPELARMGTRYAHVVPTPEAAARLTTMVEEAAANATRKAAREAQDAADAAEHGTFCPICAGCFSAGLLGAECPTCHMASLEASTGEEFFE